MYATEIDDVDYAADCPRPLYRRAALRRMTTEDQLDAAMANLARTGRDRGGRADRALRMLAVAR